MIRAKKSLGQHFLADQTVLAAIIATANLKMGDEVLEIGPGTGFLTAALLQTGATIIAVEKDDHLISFLTAKFKKEIANNKLVLIHDDILTYKLQANSYKLIANIPYYLTGQIIRHFLMIPNQPQSMTLMLQKEVAKRIVDSEKQSLLSISVKCYGTPHYIRTVPRGAFRPPPRVDSAILHVNNISRKSFEKISESEFFKLLHLGFDQKRKMLGPKLKLPEKKLLACGITPKARAENLTVDQWFCLAKQNKRT